MKIEADKLTIYPIGGDRVLRRRNMAEPGSPPPAHNPALVPRRGRIPVRLIEEPIVIPAREPG